MADPAEALGFGNDRLDDYAGGRRPLSVGPRMRRTVRVLTVLGAVLVGYLLAVGLRAGRTAAITEDARHGELVELVREQRDRVTELSSTLKDLDARVARSEEQAAGLVPALDAALHRAERDAGLTPLVGPGVIVTLFDAPPDCVGAAYLCQVQDYDLQLTANNLFAAGAEAVAVGQERVIVTTALRSAGSQITANYHVLVPPYEVRAIGDPDDLAASVADVGAALEAAGSGLRMEVRTSGSVEVPGVPAPAVRVARPASAPGQTDGGVP